MNKILNFTLPIFVAVTSIGTMISLWLFLLDDNLIEESTFYVWGFLMFLSVFGSVAYLIALEERKG